MRTLRRSLKTHKGRWSGREESEGQKIGAISKSSAFVIHNARSAQKLIVPAEEAIVGSIKPFPQLAERVFL